MNDLSQIPSVDSLLNLPQSQLMIEQYGRELTIQAFRETLENIRESLKNAGKIPDSEAIINNSVSKLKIWFLPSLIPVINASGIIIHTNLGRAPLSLETIESVRDVSSGYSNLEYDLISGKRGKRSIHAESLLMQLSGAESALVVNNNAASVLLVLSALATRKRVIIANSQLVEIGGGFRVPDVMKQSGAKLVAVGTTNRVHISDYETALNEPAALVLTAHHSNFKIVGFTTEPDLVDIARASHQHNVSLVCDIGSGAMLDTAQFGLAHEPTVQETIKAGADIICFSGDKLLGGPQAGIIIGKKDLLEKIKKHPLARAVRADKLCLAGITATLIHYLKGEAIEKIPVWRMISMDIDQIKSRVSCWKKTLGCGEIIDGLSMVGGGSLPGESLPTFLLSLNVANPDQFLKKLRLQETPIIARIEGDHVLLDPRTVLLEQDDLFLKELNLVIA